MNTRDLGVKELRVLEVIADVFMQNIVILSHFQ
jgi:hypothetical protein